MPPVRGIFHSVDEQVCDDLRYAHRINLDGDRTFRRLDSKRVPLTLECTLNRIDGVVHEHPQIHVFFFEGKRTARNSRYIEEVIEQGGHMPDLAGDNGLSPLELCFTYVRRLQQLCSDANRRERVAQLMR